MAATILVVEDDATIAESIRDVLVSAGYTVPEIVSSGASALEAAVRLRPSLVLMDVQLDGPMDGIEAAQQLRDTHGIRVVYLTGITEDETLRRATQTTPLGYLKKPFGARELRIAIEIALQQASLESALAAREQLFATTLQSIGDAVLTTDSGRRITFMNRASETLVGVRPGDYLDISVDDVVRLVDARGAPLPVALDFIGAGQRAVDLPAHARLLVGAATVEVEGSIAPIEVRLGKTAGSVMVFRDVAERRRLERSVGVSDRLAAIGTMPPACSTSSTTPWPPWSRTSSSPSTRSGRARRAHRRSRSPSCSLPSRRPVRAPSV